MVASELVAGSVFAGYVIERRLGAGGMGTVYLARHQVLDMPVALKVLTPMVTGTSGSAQFRREAQLVANLAHPNIVDVKDFGDERGTLWMAMQYVPGGDLADLIEENPHGIDPDRAVRMIAAVADALDYAHAQQVIHRDVKPANIFRTTGTGGTDWILIGDFGIARSLAAEDTLTASGRWAFSQPYAPPEQRIGRPVGPRADVHALAVTLYQLLTGELPAELPISTRDPKLSAPMARVLAKATAWSMADRHPGCGDLASAATRALHAHPRTDGAVARITSGRSRVAAAIRRVSDPIGESGLHGHRRRIVTIVAAATGVLAAAIAGVLYWNSGSDPSGAAPAPAASITARCLYTTTLSVAPGVHAVVPATGDGGRHCILSIKDAAQGPLEGVKALQSALRTCYSTQITDTDGIFGDDTKRAVLTVQQQHSVKQDGVFGPQTSNAMNWPVYSADNTLQPPCRTIAH
ncbi:serine/threonine-protein kinase [Nocardia sp. NPDC059240]|uniref:serine/threonine-protein kinase n=1 Tax=Nocardia sp. NPDC059240 TaxID=3346786 RepID=UPI0036C6B42D